MESIRLGHIDYSILIVYTLFVLGIGFVLKRYMKTSTDFFLSGRSIPAWIAALAFVSANLGANEVIGMGACGAKYGMMTCHFYWLGAVAAMVFVGVFMMPFYYGSKARSVPEYLKLRFDEKTRGLNAISFAVMTIFQSGISMYALAKTDAIAVGLGLQRQPVGLGGNRARLHYPGRADFGHLQRSAPVLPDCAGLPAAGMSWVCTTSGGWTGLKAKLANVCRVATAIRKRVDQRLGEHGRRGQQPDACRMVWHGGRPGIRVGVRLLVYRLPGGAAGDGGRVDVGRAAHAGDRHDSRRFSFPPSSSFRV